MILTIATGLDSTDRVIVVGIFELILVITFLLILNYKRKNRD